MTIHSIIPDEEIFRGWETHRPRFAELTLNGVTMQVERINDTQARIVRLISPNANDYLNPSLAPGSLIEFVPTLHEG